jgi:hypothetical protein
MTMEPIGKPYEFPVERGKIREFARAIRAESPALLSDPAPIAPPTFLVTAALWSDWYDRYLGELASLGDLLHAEQEFEYPDGPPAAGAVLTARELLESVEVTPGRRGWQRERRVVVTEFVDADGATVSRSRSTFVLIGRTGSPP